MLRRVLVVAVALVLAQATAAGAEAPAPPEPIGDDAKERRWYGYQTLAADAFFWGLSLKDDTASAGMVVVPPFVHLLNRRPRMFWASLGLRLGGVVLGGLGGLAVAARDDCGHECTSDMWHDVRVGAVMALVAVGLFDAVFMSTRTVERSQSPVVPIAIVRDGGGLAGIAGTF